MISIERETVDELYTETLFNLHVSYIEEETRGGPVRSFAEPVMWALTNPRNRILINTVRDANPFFHVMEFIWMMSGEPKIEWITQFSKNYGNFADDYAGYGYAWRHKFGFDQIAEVIALLKQDPNTRRAVLTMWKPDCDLTLQPRKEVACNTQIYFRNIRGRLDMTVTNRSNDIIWGALGANVVHMTMLHELIAHGAGLQLGIYRAFSTNAHMYENMPRFEELWEFSPYGFHFVEQCRPLLEEEEGWENFVEDAENFVSAERMRSFFKTKWFREVACPVYSNFFQREEPRLQIACPAWSRACEEWLQRRSIQAKAGV